MISFDAYSLFTIRYNIVFENNPGIKVNKEKLKQMCLFATAEMMKL